jgi:regulator of replication initiation timing
LRRDLHDLEIRAADRLRAVADNLRASGLSKSEVTHALVREREKFKKQLEKKREELRQSDLQIDRLFKKSASQTLVRLYHEAFHAYLRNNVYPRQNYDVPSWLNEGLAMIFEDGLLEGNTLRVDAPNPVTLKKLKAELAGPAPLELEKLLGAGESQFLLTASSRSAAVDRYYVYAWGLVYYLTFEKNLLGGPALEKYVQSGNAQLAPSQRVQQLIGMPLEQFERQWRAYIRTL